jgi:aspartyl-tRNA(Asn)/glutamyl-tRNA(Gln) amidotransferase subunit C
MASTDDVKKLAALARIEIPDEKLDAFAREFDTILAYVGRLDELSIPNGEKRALPAVRNVFREDSAPHSAGAFTDVLVEQFPDREGNALKVKQIITHE